MHAYTYSCCTPSVQSQQRTKPKLTPAILPILLPILWSGTMQVHRMQDQEHVYGGGMHMELCTNIQPQCDHECDAPPCCICHSPPKPGREATLFQRQLKRSLPFIFYSFSLLFCLCSLYAHQSRQDGASQPFASVVNNDKRFYRRPAFGFAHSGLV